MTKILNLVPIHNAPSSAASIDTIFVSFHTAVQKCKSVQIRGIELKSNCMSWLFQTLKAFLIVFICLTWFVSTCGSCGVWLAPFYLAGSLISIIWITLVRFKIVWFECRHLWFYWWIRDPLKGWRGSRVGWWCEACRHREFPAFDGWIAVVQQVLESIRIFVGGDAKIQVRLSVNLYISIGFRF